MLSYYGGNVDGMDIEGMVDRRDDRVFFNEDNTQFIRLSGHYSDNEYMPCLALFNTDRPFTPIRAKALSKSWNAYSFDVEHFAESNELLNEVEQFFEELAA